MSRYCFGDWRFDADQGLLANAREQHHLRPQTALVLARLLERAGEVVSRDELRELLWPGNVVVDFDTGISSCIKQIRQVLGESAADPAHLWTVPKKGFRFEAGESLANGTRRWHKALGLALLLALTLTSGAVAVWVGLAPAMQVVAVLPFEDFAATPQSARLAQRIHEDLIVSLGRLNPGQLATISRRSVTALDLDGMSAEEVGQRLGATQLIDGSIRPLSDGYMVTITLVSVGDGRFLWGELVEVNAAQPADGLAILREVAVAALHPEIVTQSPDSQQNPY